MKLVIALLTSLCTLGYLEGNTTIATAADGLAWPRFRGPNGSGVADKQRPPAEIGPDKNVKWKVKVPSGLSSPIVAGDKLVITAFEDGKLLTIAYNRADGSEAWRAHAPARELERFHKVEGSPAASTPATDGERIVSYFGSCGLFCYDMAGKELWKYDMPPARTAMDFGTGVSPIIADSTVVLVRDEVKEPKIVALDLATGSPRWEKPRQSKASYATPVVWDTPEGKQVAVAGHAQLIGYDLITGDQKWFFAGIPTSCVSSPVIADGVLYFAGGAPTGPDDKEIEMPTYDSMLKDLDKDKDGALSRDEAEKTFQGFFDNQDANKDGKFSRDEYETIAKFLSEGKNAAFALSAGGRGDVTTSHLRWKKAKGLPYIASAILYRGQYVMVRDGGIITAYDAQTGDEIYQKRAAPAGSYYASPVGAGGHIYVISLNDGVVTVLKAGASSPEVAAQNAPLGERVSATPAIADNTLYIRTAEHLYAFGEKK